MKPTILILEDMPLNLIMLSRRLSKNGFDILELTHGEQLMPMLDQSHPDLILMDLGLPGLDGWTLTRQLKANPKTCAIPVIAVTAYAMAGDRQRALDAGCDDYITKPIDFQHLLRMIVQHLEADHLQLHRLGPGTAGPPVIPAGAHGKVTRPQEDLSP